MTTPNDALSIQLRDVVVTAILDSPLNISYIPDALEREIYERIFEALETAVTSRGFAARVRAALVRVFRCDA